MFFVGFNVEQRTVDTTS